MTSLVPEEKLREIAAKLLERTRAGEVAWEPDDKYEQSFAVTLPKSKIAISYRPQRQDPAVYLLSVRDPNDVEVGQWSVLTGKADDSRLMADLYQEASRGATKWDEVLKDIDTALRSKGQIGHGESWYTPGSLRD
jgi:hypothetical protein